MAMIVALRRMPRVRSIQLLSFLAVTAMCSSAEAVEKYGFLSQSDETQSTTCIAGGMRKAPKRGHVGELTG